MCVTFIIIRYLSCIKDMVHIIIYADQQSSVISHHVYPAILSSWPFTGQVSRLADLAVRSEADHLKCIWPAVISYLWPSLKTLITGHGSVSSRASSVLALAKWCTCFTVPRICTWSIGFTSLQLQLLHCNYIKFITKFCSLVIAIMISMLLRIC